MDSSVRPTLAVIQLPPIQLKTLTLSNSSFKKHTICFLEYNCCQCFCYKINFRYCYLYCIQRCSSICLYVLSIIPPGILLINGSPYQTSVNKHYVYKMCILIPILIGVKAYQSRVAIVILSLITLQHIESTFNVIQPLTSTNCNPVLSL